MQVYSNLSGSGNYLQSSYSGLFGQAAGEQYHYTGELQLISYTLEYVEGSKALQSSFFSGEVSNQDIINTGIAFVGSNLSTMEGLVRNEANAFKAKGIVNGMNSYYRRGLKNLSGAAEDFGKYGKKLGVVGAVLTAGNLLYKYETTGITRKDAFDAVVSGALLLVTVTNPIGLIGLGVYGLLDSLGAFNGVKEAIGMDDRVIAKDE